MASIEQVLPLSGPMVDHIDSSYVQSEQGVVKMRTNMRPDFTGSLFANVPVKGTIELFADLPPGTNKVLGWCRDNENNSIIYFIYNLYAIQGTTVHNHSILSLNIITDVITPILIGEPELGFTSGTVVNAQVADGRLYWNDNVSEPKSLNIQKAKNYAAGLTVNAYNINDRPFAEKVFPLIKQPPLFAPKVEYSTKTEYDGVPINFNNLRKKQWQVKYCYGYEDFQESAYSEISKLINPAGEVGISGEWTDEITQNNALKIVINTGSNNVKYIRVAVRDASETNSAPFYEFAKIQKFNGETEIVASDNDAYEVFFLNNTYLENIDTAYGNAYAHNVPLAAKDMLLLDGKYLAMTMPKLGYDFKVEDLLYTVQYKEVEVDFDSDTINIDTVNSGWYRDVSDWCGKRTNRTQSVEIHIPTKFYPDSLYKAYVFIPNISGNIFVVETDGYTTVEATYTTGATEPTGLAKTIRDSFITQLNNQIDKCAQIPIRVQPHPSEDNILVLYFYIDKNAGVFWDKAIDNIFNSPSAVYNAVWEAMLGEDLNKFPYGNVTTGLSSPTFSTLKGGQYHPFGIVYNDGKGRNQIVFGDKKVFSPLYETGGANRVIKPQIIIRNIPPEWATTFRIAYIPNNSYTFFQYVSMVEVVEGTGIDDTTNNIPINNYFLKINQAILHQIEHFSNSLTSSYVWQNGDRIRRYGETDSYEILREYTRTYKETLNSEESITETGFLVEHDFDTYSTTGRIDNVEIYRPNRNPQNKIYKEIGESFEIIAPGTANRAHSGNTQNQVYTTALPGAIIDLDFGDVYFRKRLTGNGDLTSTVVEDANFSDYYTSSGISIGRDVISTDSKQSVLKRIVISENYIANTELNRLNIFLPETEFYTVSENYGDIIRILERGDTLKIIQPHRETSVYIGKNYAKDGNGGDIVLATDRVFGSVNPYESYAGSSYPRSVASSDNYVYFFDHINGDFYRSSSNGTASISKEYGMNTWFDDMSGRFRAYRGDKDIITYFEAPTETVWLSFIMGTSIETIVFSESETSKGFMFTVQVNNGTTVPENMAWYGDFTYLFSNGKAHKLGAGAYNSFLGSTRKSASITFIGNQYPQLQKTFEVLSLNTDGDWTAELTCDSDSNYPFGQKTKIFPQRFQKSEGVLTAGIPMNIINRVGVEDLNKLYGGNKMVGNAVKVSMESSNFAILREVKLKSLNSK